MKIGANEFAPTVNLKFKLSLTQIGTNEFMPTENLKFKLF